MTFPDHGQASRDVTAQPGRRLVALSGGLARIHTLRALFDDFDVIFGERNPVRPEDTVIAWGLRPSAAKARGLAAGCGASLRHVEDGLLRSVGLGVDDPPLSLMVDDLAIYLDASAPTELEAHISRPLDIDQRLRAQMLMQIWRDCRVSKYNHAPDIGSPWPRPYVLVVDQTLGDASISAGMASKASFHRMLDAALAENPDAEVVLKVHPEVVRGRKQGHFDLSATAKRPRVKVMSDDVHPVGLIEHAQAVYVVTSQVGFEALMWGKRVRVFGMPFYASWGLTEDELPPLPRRSRVELPQLVHGALISYPRYVDPETSRRCEPERVIEWLGLQRAQRARFAPRVTAFGFSKWKQPFVRDFLNGSTVRFAKWARQVDHAQPLAVWGLKHDGLLARRGRMPDQPIRIEDGFLRSVGLGADLIRPLSWVLDPVGIYYDATRPSLLEQTLAHREFDDVLVVRARALRERLLAARLTKYNLSGRTGWTRPAEASRVILVPGQVESDASIRFGGRTIRRNMDLLRTVREACPDAWVIYKPHPDVAAQLRREGEGEDRAREWCDEVLTDLGMDVLLDVVDEVHTMTSLTGFEALLRGKSVVVYGQPFYAGWGLTRDVDLDPVVAGRRGRPLSLDELVAATLILYPTYVSRHTHRFTTPEHAMDELIAWRTETPVVSRWQRFIAQLFRKP